MPLDLIRSSDMPVIWRNFSKYLFQPYQNNQSSQEEVGAWFNELFDRDKRRQELELSFVEVRNEVTGHRFDAFCLNNQMYFSRDMAVLTLPQPGTITQRSDRDIGVWLHDFGKADAKFEAAIVEALADINSPSPILAIDGSVDRTLGKLIFQPFQSPYTDHVIETLSHLNNPLYSGREDSFRQANTLNPFMRKLAIAQKKPAFPHNHRDSLDFLTYPWLSPEASLAPHWNRNLIHPKVQGTIFRIGREESISVDCPPEAVSVHLGCKNAERSDILISWGALHGAGGHSLGRSVIMLETYDAPIPALRGPWAVTVKEKAKPSALPSALYT